MATTSGRLVRTPTHEGQPPRRGMVPISGLMILFAVLMFGLALAIPSSRAIQEAEMRDRIAAAAPVGGDDEQDDSESTASAAELPAIAELDDDESDTESENTKEQADESTEPDQDGEESRGTDLATQITETRSDEEAREAEDKEAEKVPRKPKPTHIRIPSVEIDTEILQVGYVVQEIDGQRVREWEVASYAAGHHKTSARPGEGGNIVITGHNDWEGEVFRTLEYVKHGEEIFITTDDGERRYVIEEIHMRREVGATLEERLETGRFMAEMPEERVTLITCWPYGINDHRVIVVAVPAD